MGEEYLKRFVLVLKLLCLHSSQTAKTHGLSQSSLLLSLYIPFNWIVVLLHSFVSLFDLNCRVCIHINHGHLASGPFRVIGILHNTPFCLQLILSRSIRHRAIYPIIHSSIRHSRYSYHQQKEIEREEDGTPRTPRRNLRLRAYHPALLTCRYHRANSQLHRRDRLQRRHAPSNLHWNYHSGMSSPSFTRHLHNTTLLTKP